MRGKAQSYYLLQTLSNSEETHQIIKNLQNLLESCEDKNIFLAFQIIHTSGVPANLITHLLVLKQWYQNKQIRQQAQHFFDIFASTNLIKYINKIWKSIDKHYTTEQKIAEKLLLIAQHPEVNKDVLGLMHLKITRSGGKFCIENEVQPIEEVLRLLIENQELSFADFGLVAIPKEIGLFQHIKVLNISGNKCTFLPTEIAQLTNLQDLIFSRTPLSNQTIEQLEQLFPHIFALNYYNEACDLKSDEKYAEAVVLFQKTIELQTAMPEAWFYTGVCYIALGQVQNAELYLAKAYQLIHELAQKYPQKPYYTYLLACYFALRKDKIAMLYYLEHALQQDSTLRQLVKQSEDFTDFLQDADFRYLLQ